jgi:hypothetical protein
MTKSVCMFKQHSWANTGGTPAESWSKSTSVDEVDKHLEDWIGVVLGDVAVSLSAPDTSQEAKGVNLYLLDLVSAPAGRGVKELSLHRIILRYLVTVSDPDLHAMHRMLGELMFAAMDLPEVEVDLEPLSSAVWSALRLAPRPAFVLRVPLLRERPEKLAPPVPTEMIIKNASLRPLRGRVLGPGDIAIMGARVEVPALHISTATDFRGRFHFSAVPSNPPIKLLRVNAKGRTISVSVEKPDEEVMIHLQESEM